MLRCTCRLAGTHVYVRTSADEGEDGRDRERDAGTATVSKNESKSENGKQNTHTQRKEERERRGTSEKWNRQARTWRGSTCGRRDKTNPPSGVSIHIATKPNAESAGGA